MDTDYWFSGTNRAESGEFLKVLVTGSAGFIGFHLTERLRSDGIQVVGIDNLNDYYETSLKLARMEHAGLPVTRNGDLPPAGQILNADSGDYQFLRMDLEDRSAMEDLFSKHSFDRVYHMAAQAGVRYSLKNPHAYGQSNLTGFLHILEGCRSTKVSHLIYASSSSVYGLNREMPFSTDHNVDHPLSLYAASKKANELMAHTYSHLYRIPTTGLRFFTVYGPWSRPDMALFLFTRAMEEDRPIDVFNEGNMKRDFTYIDDIIEGVIRVGNQPPAGMPEDPMAEHTSLSPSMSVAPYRVFNIGRGEPVSLLGFIEALEKSLGITAKKNMMPMQPGDVSATWADVTPLKEEFGYEPKVSVQEGVNRFVDWYRSYIRDKQG